MSSSPLSPTGTRWRHLVFIGQLAKKAKRSQTPFRMNIIIHHRSIIKKGFSPHQGCNSLRLPSWSLLYWSRDVMKRGFSGTVCKAWAFQIYILLSACKDTPAFSFFGRNWLKPNGVFSFDTFLLPLNQSKFMAFKDGIEIGLLQKGYTFKFICELESPWTASPVLETL